MVITQTEGLFINTFQSILFLFLLLVNIDHFRGAITIRPTLSYHIQGQCRIILLSMMVYSPIRRPILPLVVKIRKWCIKKWRMWCSALEIKKFCSSIEPSWCFLLSTYWFIPGPDGKYHCNTCRSFLLMHPPLLYLSGRDNKDIYIDNNQCCMRVHACGG